MDEYDSLSGAGPKKYLALAAHTYTSVAASIDHVLAYSTGMDRSNRRNIESLSSRLKHLASRYPDYGQRPFPEYWAHGREISRDLSAEVAHMQRLGRL